MNDPVRVLVVDDSALMRKLIPKILRADDSIQVVGTAMDGIFGLKKIEELNASGHHARPGNAGNGRSSTP